VVFPATGVLLQRGRAQAEDEAGATPFRLSPRSCQSPQTLFELTYEAKGKRVNVKLTPEATTLYKAASLLINASFGFRRTQAFRRVGGSSGRSV
jgi:hypothetical protein